MSVASTPDRPAPRARPSRSLVLAAVVAAAAAGVMLALSSSLLGSPARVEVTVENPTEYSIHVQVRSEPDGPVTRLGQVARQSTQRFSSVLDQGETWYVDFRYGGVDAGGAEITRDALANGTPIVVPDDVGRVLADAGLPPSPS